MNKQTNKLVSRVRELESISYQYKYGLDQTGRAKAEFIKVRRELRVLAPQLATLVESQDKQLQGLIEALEKIAGYGFKGTPDTWDETACRLSSIAQEALLEVLGDE